jgi:hypothetical protein
MGVYPYGFKSGNKTEKVCALKSYLENGPAKAPISTGIKDWNISTIERGFSV